PRIAPFIGEILAIPFPDDLESMALRTARSDPRLMGDRIRRAWLDLVRAECDAAPLVIALEDAHWSERESLGFVGTALRELSDKPLFVLALAREENDLPVRATWGGRVMILALPRLSARASGRLVRAVLGNAVDEATVARLVERCDGNA